ncbi:DUF7344 domain-containing protein [Halovivax limisalsi]|uniref:DUF7344 domain-containing protein n=1 Tax=Halovivax limisalsi TaxID=1453760 RepID=UPI001FFC533D|nr:hypothetical protein [Halovivax limisalsi]
MSQSRNRAADERVRSIELPASDRHELLASRRRRQVIAVLETAPRTVDLADVAAAIAAMDGPDGGPDADPDRIAIELHHVHLPKLADAGVIEYDPTARLVAVPDESIESIRDGA